MSGDAEDTNRIEQFIGAEIEPTDVVGAYGPPGEYEILLVDTAPADADQLASALQVALESAGLSVLTGLA